MCLIAFQFDPDSPQPIMLAANRDEFFTRPTQDPGWWPDHPGVFGGRDTQAGGTWMAVSMPLPPPDGEKTTSLRTCRFAALTNVRGRATRDAPASHAVRPSRGHLVTRLLTSALSLEATMQALSADHRQYDGFNLFAFEWQAHQVAAETGKHSIQELHGWHLSNSGPYRQQVVPLEPGIHGVSNGAFNEDWPKTSLLTNAVKKAKAASSRAAADEILLSALKNSEPALHSRLPDTGVGTPTERELSMPFIRTRFESSGEQATYGTRTSTLFNLSLGGSCRFRQISWENSAVLPTVSAVREMQIG